MRVVSAVSECKLWGSTFLTGESDPAVQTGTAPVATVTLRAVLTLTAVCAVWAVVVCLTLDVASCSSLPQGTEASSCHGVTWRVALTVAHLGTILTISTLFTHSMTASSLISRRTDALA